MPNWVSNACPQPAGTGVAGVEGIFGHAGGDASGPNDAKCSEGGSLGIYSGAASQDQG